MLFQWFNLVVSFLSIILNLLLLYAYFKISNTVLGAYKYFILLFIVCDILYSLAILIAQPAVIVYEGTVGLVASSGIPNIHILQAHLTISVDIAIIFLCCYFYRYQVLCLYTDFQKRLVRIVVVLLSLEMFITEQIFVTTAFQPKPAVAETVFKEAKRVYDLDMTDKEVFAYNTSDGTGWTMGLVYLVVVHVFVTIFASIFCGYKIVKKMNLCIISENTRRLNKKLFRLLICQSTVPVFFLYSPWVTYSLYAIYEESMNEASLNIDNFLSSLFPLANAIVLLIFMDKYRLCIRRLFGFNPHLSTSVHVISSPRGSERVSYRQTK